MVKYDTGIEFTTSKEINNCSLPIGKVNCVLIKPKKPLVIANKEIHTFRLILESPDFQNAVDCMELICSTKSIIDSVVEIDKDKLLGNIYIGERNRICGNSCGNNYSDFIEMSEHSRGWYFAILIAEKAIDDIHSRIAVLKYYNARIIYDIHPRDLDPLNYDDDQFSTLLDKLRFAYSIIDINSIVEELGMEIRANSQKPSTIHNNWNEVVLKDLESRLIKSKIEPNRLIPWLSRRENKRPFKSLVIYNTNLCPWSDNVQILDFYISIKDAILELDYERDKLASHCVGDRIYDLSIIDLENSFCLLRTILLDYFEIHLDF